jgi:sodium/bile acid cotransporter 7
MDNRGRQAVTFLHFLARRWFLIALLLGITFTLLWTPGVAVVVNALPPRVTVAIVLGLMSSSLETRRLWQALRRPAPVLWALLVTYGLLPLAGWAVGPVLPGVDYQIGLLVITSVPCTLAAAIIWTRMGGGNEAVALLVTLLTSALSWLVTTAWLTLTTGQRVSVDPLAMMLTLILSLIVPVGLGQLARWPDSTRALLDRGKAFLGVVAQLLVLAIILQAVALAADRLRSTLVEEAGPLLVVALACMAIHGLGLLAGFAGGSLLRLDRGERMAVAIAGSQKTMPVSLLLVTTYFAGYPLAVVPVLFYHVGQLIVDTAVVDVRHWRRKPRPLAA